MNMALMEWVNSMADDLAQRGKPDRDRINVHEDHEVRYWTQKFGVTADELKNAVTAAGPMAKDVAAKLGKSV